MSEKHDQKERSFINEKIVPRNNLKKVIIYVLSALGLGVLFGVVAAVSYFATSDLLEKKPETQPSQIIIVRDDTTESSSSETAPPTESAAESTSETESQTRETRMIEPDVITTQETEPELTLSEIYDRIRESIVDITIIRNKGTDWFDSEVTAHLNVFGVIIAETDEAVFVLTDSANIEEGDTIATELNGYLVYAEVNERDDRTHIGILKLLKSSFEGEVTAAPLGNSFHIKNSDRIYMAGAPLNVTGEVNEGIVTNVLSDVAVVDGYLQMIYTNMAAAEGGSAILFNEEGEILGWISDYTSGSGTAVAAGISGLKYILEDTLSGAETAYLGIRCREISEYESLINGIPAGLYIEEVEEDSPAFSGGLHAGDCMTSLNGYTISGNHILQVRMDDLLPGQEVPVIVERLTPDGYEPLELRIIIGSR